MLISNPITPIPDVVVIGVGHKARQGKDTIANYLVKLGAERHGFADDLYAVARVMFGMTKKDPKLLQVLGTDVFRRMNENIWLSSMYYKLLDRKPDLVVIPDVRFPNEAALVKSLGGIMVRVDRLNPDGSQYIAADRDPSHPSESSLDNYDGWDMVISAESGDMKSLKAGASRAFDFAMSGDKIYATPVLHVPAN